MYDKCYFCLDQLPKLKKESTASFFVNFGRSRGTKEPTYITVPKDDWGQLGFWMKKMLAASQFSLLWQRFFHLTLNHRADWQNSEQVHFCQSRTTLLHVKTTTSGDIWKSCAGRQTYLTIFTLQSAIWWTFPHICIPFSRTITPSLFVEGSLQKICFFRTLT